MREEARRGIDADEGSGALAASSMTRSKSSAAGVFRMTDKADRGHRARAQDADRVTELCAFLSLLQVCLSSDERFDYCPLQTTTITASLQTYRRRLRGFGQSRPGPLMLAMHPLRLQRRASLGRHRAQLCRRSRPRAPTHPQALPRARHRPSDARRPSASRQMGQAPDGRGTSPSTVFIGAAAVPPSKADPSLSVRRSVTAIPSRTMMPTAASTMARVRRLR